MAKKLTGRARRKRRIRKKVSGTPVRPRLAVFRSNKQIYAQVIDDENGTTLASACSLGMKRPVEEKPAEPKAAEGEPVEQGAAEGEPAEQRDAEGEAAEPKAAEERPAGKKGADKKGGDNKGADKKAVAEGKPAGKKPGKAKLSGKTRLANSVGVALAEICKERGITAVVFDRGGYQYHGRVKALAEGARKGGLKF